MLCVCVFFVLFCFFFCFECSSKVLRFPCKAFYLKDIINYQINYVHKSHTQNFPFPVYLFGGKRGVCVFILKTEFCFLYPILCSVCDVYALHHSRYQFLNAKPEHRTK